MKREKRVRSRKEIYGGEDKTESRREKKDVDMVCHLSVIPKAISIRASKLNEASLLL